MIDDYRERAGTEAPGFIVRSLTERTRIISLKRDFSVFTSADASTRVVLALPS
jgi:hypothetical protein